MKKIIAFLLAVCIVSALVACSGTGAQQTAAPTASSAASAEPTAAQLDWPKRPITIVVGYSAGGDLDLNARAYAERLSKILGAEVVVSNVTGSSGAVAAQQVKDSEPDGYTVFYHQPSLMISQLQGMTDFGLEAFDMSCMAAYLPGDLICVNKSLGIKTMEELHTYCQAHSGELNLAASAGTMNYIQALQMNDLGFDVNIVDGGNATERVANLLGGHVDIILNSYATVKDYLATGEFVALATASSDRAKAYSDIPTASEQGYNIYFDKYHYFAFPKGTDAAIVDAFAQACKQVTEDPDYQSYIWDNWGQEPCWMSAADASEVMDSTWTMLQDYADALKG